MPHTTPQKMVCVGQAIQILEEAPWGTCREMAGPTREIIFTGNRPLTAFGDLRHFWYTLSEAAMTIHRKGTGEEKIRALEAIRDDASGDDLAKVLAWRHYG